ncbi:GtrA family protein [Litchfieldia salsa]|uniref:Putative flippase GtrA (Transmembrane translocase of bactoprenol-linked glucose) n=1 Tax=Litchfieldia salsa TaxID=930152 RepID=A0A1H0VLF4_9BACI|nr:GtrA family protein [Litchfieldia salsa]SDP78886.1 Putative flippase GtrA (transmembrane translocase of bactoprenol-linked glucose) [Litchfieldia salsa]
MRFNQSELFRFVIVGGINTFHYYVLYLFLLHVVESHYFVAHSIGFLSSLIGSFFLNTTFTYKVKPTWAAFIRYPLTQLFNTSATSLLLFLFIEILQMNSSVAPIIAVLFTLPATFILTGRVLKKSWTREKVNT